MVGRIGIADVQPTVSCGRYPARAVVGEIVTVSATVFREGHDAVAADIAVTRGDGSPAPFLRMVPGSPGTDRWSAELLVDAPGTWTFTVQAWSESNTNLTNRFANSITISSSSFFAGTLAAASFALTIRPKLL